MTFHLLHLKGVPIFEQLKLEEALLRNDKRNFLLLNESSPPALVMGISGKPEQLVDHKKAQALGIPLIKRFSGGGTVVIDEDTLFVTFICQKNLHPFPAYPEPILKWTASLYTAAFPSISLRENDYVIGEKKCGGNAQYIQKERWLHHTSFLWNFKKEHMELLLYPPKTPAYRAGRAHTDFLTPLSAHFKDKEEWVERFKAQVGERFELQHCSVESVLPLLELAHSRIATVFVSL